MASLKKNSGPSKDAIMRYMEKKRAEQDASKEKRFKDLLNPYRALKKDKLPDEDFVKAQKRRERILKKKEKLIAERIAQETAQKEAEAERTLKEMEAKRKAELKERERLKQERLRKIASVGHSKPVDKKMKEYLEKIRLSKEADRRKQLEEEKKERERKKNEEKALQKIMIDEVLAKRRAKMGLSKAKDGSNNCYGSTKPKASVASVTMNKSRSNKSRADEYSPTRPGLNHKASISRNTSEEYIPTKVSHKSSNNSNNNNSRQTNAGYKPSKIICDGQSSAKKLNTDRRETINNDRRPPNSTAFNGAKKLNSSAPALTKGIPREQEQSDDEEDYDIRQDRERIKKLEEELRKAKELEKRKLEAKEKARSMARKPLPAQPPQASRNVPSIPNRTANRAMPSNRIVPIGLNYRRNINRKTYDDYDDDDYEDDEEMRDFIDDGEGYEESKETISECIKEIFGYDKKKYAYMDDDDDIEETSYAQQMKEERASARAGYLEDLEDIRKEKEERARKERLKKKMAIIDSSEEDE